MRAGALGTVIEVGEGSKFSVGDAVSGTFGMITSFFACAMILTVM
jgi:hypothetical protein